MYQEPVAYKCVLNVKTGLKVRTGYQILKTDGRRPFSRWLTANGLSLNVNQTNVIHFNSETSLDLRLG